MKAGLHLHEHLVAAVVTTVVLCHAVCEPALADDVRPAYLDIEEFDPGAFRVVWKVPLNQGFPALFAPSFPESFRATSTKTRVATPTAAVERWTMVCGTEPLAGATVGVDGLDETTVDVLVRVQLADGSLHRTVLRPTEPITTIPVSEPSVNRQDDDDGRSVLRRADRWRYALLLALAWLLSLNPLVSRRGIILCTVALSAGCVCGHALGGRPVREKLPPARMRSDVEAKRVLGGLMLNTYRAFILDDDEAAYDVLARSVAGEFLTGVYLQNRDALGMDTADAAVAIVDRLDIKSIESRTRLDNGAIAIVASWDVYGSVRHWGHVHFRCNAYRAELTVVPTDGYWKLTRMNVLDVKRVM